jgi:uncharacterized metal-binding protein
MIFGDSEAVALVAEIISKFRNYSVCCVLCVNPTGCLKSIGFESERESMKKKNLEV